jgi:deazaflavin-dependent oxidoreductase (nitroreductase family)
VFEKYIANPIVRQAVRAGVAPKAFALLETTGRRSGQPRRTPIGGGLDDNAYWLVAEHGDRAAYVRNLIADPDVRVKIGRRWRAGRAVVLPDDDGYARRRLLDRRNGFIGRVDGIAFRAAATAPLTIRIDLDPPADGD